MFERTGCAGIAIGRGALANPWCFRQLTQWLQTGDPGSRGTYEERIKFMATHLQRLIDWKGEKYGCIQFRKVSTWYSRALRTGRLIQQTLVQLSDWVTFQAIANALLEKGPPPCWVEQEALGTSIPVPSGPIAHW
jgi:tRNA-dihydrouridine synthase